MHRRMVVQEIMTKNPVTVESSDSIRVALTTLLELDIRHLPIVEEGQLVGIVSDRDLRRLAPPVATDDGAAARMEKQLAQPVSTLMSSDVLSVDPEMEVAEVVDLMIEHRVGAIPVVEPGSERLVGIVSYIDLLKAARDAF
jgi:acetoin utilization protein AcuB